MAEYEVLEEDMRDYVEGNELEVVVKNRDTFESIPVRAIIFKSTRDVADGEVLWARALETGVFKKEPWTIRILEEIPADEYALKTKPRKKGI